MKKLIIPLIRFYQRTISAKTPPVCRFTPTCSAYAIQAIERFGVIHGGALAVWRILRCNPFGKYGYDPVPEKKSPSFRSRFFKRQTSANHCSACTGDECHHCDRENFEHAGAVETEGEKKQKDEE